MALLLLVVAVIWLTVRQPWMGLGLTADTAADAVIVMTSQGPASQVSPQSRLQTLQGQGLKPVELQTLDLIEEPDTLESYADINHFLARQKMLQEHLDGRPLNLTLTNPEGVEQQVTLQPLPSRPLSSLPAAFWIQLAAGAGGFLIGLWVLVLRPGDGGARSFAISGVGLMLSAFAAAVYSVRELVIPSEIFHALSTINHVGTALFGCAMMALFLLFPRPLIRPVWLWAIPGILLPWLLLDILQAWPSPAIGLYLPILLETLLILLFIVLQWRKTQGHPLQRAALRWLGLSFLLTASLFVMAAAAPALLGWEPVMSQAHAFGFFLILYAGLALGVHRYRLFDLDRWSFHLLLWVAGATTLLVLDLILIMLLHMNSTLSLSLSLLVCGFLWLPFRGWLWRRLVERQTASPHEVFRRVMQIALAPTDSEHRQRWTTLVQDLFAPLQIQTMDASTITSPAIAGNGLSLLLPAVGRAPALELSHAGNGRRLFTPYDAERMKEITEMLHYANDSRDAYNQGVREERGRIARDLHDDIGSRLLTGLHQPRLEETRRTIQHAITDMRTIINGLTGTEIQLEVLIAELRHETSLRLEAGGITLDWPLHDGNTDVTLGYRVYRNYLSVMRELVSNILRHAKASRVHIDVHYRNGELTTSVSDNGIGLPATSDENRHGLGNLQRRVSDLNGRITFENLTQGGTCITLILPLPAFTPAP